jgi:hypothetical protein
VTFAGIVVDVERLIGGGESAEEVSSVKNRLGGITRASPTGGTEGVVVDNTGTRTSGTCCVEVTTCGTEWMSGDDIEVSPKTL